MNARAILLVIAIVVVGMFSCAAKAGENQNNLDALTKMVEDKQIVYKGGCLVDSKAELSFDEAKATGQMRCVVGVTAGDEDNFFVLLYSGEKPYKLIKFSKSTQKQVVLWIDNKAGV